ncbi:heparinase II/III domain-containing protein [Paenibacillus cremeus]|uniref:Heparinase n=1 Tax=Paenibacillus cremeus TaxID=2163881 RepID=A0A559KIS3_9BACL|nr:heparinase II/III family protein [Paenibacillus cremeus]TVY12021.1 heparinase [Paenibacillus cremeus]
MFTERYVNDELQEWLIPKESFKPYPAIEDREPWDSLPESTRHRWISAGEQYLGYSWPTLPAVLYMDFVRNGNRTRYQDIYFNRREALAKLVIAECMENSGRFVDEIINGVWSICEESYWVVPAHKSISLKSAGDPLPDVSDQVIDLFAAETGALLAWTHYLLGSRLERESRIVTDRIRLEMKRRILDPFLERDDFWWMGLGDRKNVNNWNPWIHSNCITAFLLMEEDAHRRVQGIQKSLHSLDSFMNIHHSDGGCDEGPGYWGRAGASLFDCLEMLYMASDGRINVYGEPLVKEIGRYIYRAHISGNNYVNFADGDAKLSIEADVVYRFGLRIDDPRMAALGASAFESGRGGKPKRLSLLRAIPALFNERELALAAQKSEPPFVRDVWMDGIEVMTAREREGSDRGLFLAAKGGHNHESHNHNDVGHFIVYADGKPFLIDIGVEEYTSKTFSPRRYEIWTMQSVYHNLPTVEGVHQQAGRPFAASDVKYHCGDELAGLTLDISKAYPLEAGIEQWKRSYMLHRSADDHFIEIVENFKLRHESKDIMLSLMTVCSPQLGGGGFITLQNAEGDKLQLEYDDSVLEAASERIEVEDHRLRQVWGDELFRIVLKAKAPASEGTWTTRIRQL